MVKYNRLQTLALRKAHADKRMKIEPRIDEHAVNLPRLQIRHKPAIAGILDRYGITSVNEILAREANDFDPVVEHLTIGETVRVVSDHNDGMALRGKLSSKAIGKALDSTHVR